jgi:hypothetical protein
MNQESPMQHDGQMVIGLFVLTFVHVDLCKKIDSFPILLLLRKLVNSFNNPPNPRHLMPRSWYLQKALDEIGVH